MLLMSRANGSSPSGALKYAYKIIKDFVTRLVSIKLEILQLVNKSEKFPSPAIFSQTNSPTPYLMPC